MSVVPLAGETSGLRQMSHDDADPHYPEGVAIVGIGCRYPGGIDGPEGFWSLLAAGKSAITEIPEGRWDRDNHYNPDPEHPLTQHVRHGGFVSDIDKFDAGFFGVSPREAVCMDPQQRLMMEVAWRAMEDAGYTLETIRNREVGVFVGISSNDYGSLLWVSDERLAIPDNEPYILPGNTGCIAANRLSYFFDLKGPSFTVDTACSSSLVAVHLACESLLRGESKLAFVGGVQALIHPGVQFSFCKAGLLAPDGRCKSFDASANGYVRSEGAGMVLLKPYGQALADGDQIYAVIRGSAVNSDGRSNGMVAPNLRAQVACVKKAFENAAIPPGRTQYVEAHGTGTRQGDPIELRALGSVLSQGRSEETPCRVGSVKTNLGHSETAAGITGLIKAALCIRHRQLPPSLNFETPNPSIDFQGLKLKVQTELTPFPEPDKEHVVGVSSFGFGGTNAHVVLSDAQSPGPAPSRYGLQAPMQLLALSARTPRALTQLAGSYLQLLEQQPGPALHDLCASTHLHRSSFRERTVCLASDRAELISQLQAICQGSKSLPAGVLHGLASRRPGKLAWLFTGQGSQSPGMAGEVLREHPCFRAAFERVCNLLDPHLDQPLASLIDPPGGDQADAATTLASTGYTQPALFAVGYALSQLWLQWGVEPDLLLGHSIGEVLAAHLAGVFSLEDACRLVIARSRLMQALPSNGGMAAVLCSAERLKPWLAVETTVGIAAYNGPSNTVISGPLESLQRVMASAESAGLEVRPLRVSHAFHSPAMAPMLASFEQELRQITFSAPTKVLISNLTGDAIGAEIAQPEYWCEHVINPVRFEQGISSAVAKGAQVFLEIGARPTLIGMSRQCLQDPSLTYLPSFLPGQSSWRSLYSSLAHLFVLGHPISWQGFHQAFEHRRVTVPGYPFERQSYWWSRQGEISGTSLWADHVGFSADRVASRQEIPAADPVLESSPQRRHELQLLDLPSPERHYRRSISATEPADLRDHCIRKTVVFPAAGFIDQACDLLSQEKLPLQLTNLVLDQPLKLGDASVSLLIEYHPDPGEESAYLRFHSRSTPADGANWVCHGRAELPGSTSFDDSVPFDPESAPADLQPLNLEGFYAALDRFGLSYGPTFQALNRLTYREDHAWAELQRPAGAADRGLLDSCFQAVAALLDPTASGGQLLLPVGLTALSLVGLPLPDRFSCQVKLRRSSEPAFVICDLVLHQGDTILGWIEGFKLRRLPRQALEWLFPLASETEDLQDSPGSWLIGQTWTELTEAEIRDSAGQGPDGEFLLLGRTTQQAGSFAAWCDAQALPISSHGLDHTLPNGSGPVLIWPDLVSSTTASIEHVCSQVLLLIQQLASGAARPVWLVLEGDGAAQGALEGLIKTAALEYPQISWTVLRLPGALDAQPAADVWPLIWQAACVEANLRWHDGRLQGRRLERLQERERFRLGTSNFGSLEDLEWQSLPPLSLAPGEVEIAVEATGLNFRDVLNALGLLAAYSAQLGMDAAAKVPFGGECVGRVVAVGEDVDRSLLGERVLAALAVGSLASHVLCRADLCVPLPPGLSAELGASLSTVFLTSLYGLDNLAALQPGETVLIHAAAGGVGQAALQVAKSRGARILATASQAKQAALLDQGVEVVFDSRSLDFADQVLRHTEGRGVDVVLNSLKGEWVDASFKALAHGGRFVELGKIEIWSSEQARERRPDARYLPFDLLEVAAADPQLVRTLLIGLLHDIDQGRYQPIPMQVFPIEQTVDAFRLMAQAKHVGKVVIRQPDRPAPLTIRPQATYLVTGALGGIGLQLMEWLASQGATSLVGIARSATDPSTTASVVLDRLRAAGVSCQLLALDLGVQGEAAVSTRQALTNAIANLPAGQPLAGVFHAAGILDDGLIVSQTEARLKHVMAPKLRGWELLHQALPQEPFFVGFSSMASLLGSPGQVTYSAANGALDDDCLARSHRSSQANGVHLSLQWGPWAGAGMAGVLGERDRKRFEMLGVGLLEPGLAFEALRLALQRGQGGTVAVLNNNWQRIAEQSDSRQARVLQSLIGTDVDGADAASGVARQALLARLNITPDGQHHEIVVRVLQDNLAKVMGLDDSSSLDPGESLFQIGLDSLMAVELAATIQRDLGVKLELESLAGDPTLDGLGNFVLAALKDPSDLKQSALNLAREASLPDDWVIDSGRMVDGCPGEEILLTGGSGFLGAYLLAGQLQRWPDLRIRCLVRARDAAHGLERIRSNMTIYGLWNDAWENRILAIPGDLSKPQFGLDGDAFVALGRGVGGILHNGAYLSQMASYSQLSATTVDGTRQMLDIAARNGGLPFQMISSVAVFEGAKYRNRVISEDDDISAWEGIYNGYSQTKWASERLVVHAGRKGLPITVYRPPLIAGDSRTGAWHKDDLLYRLLKGCLELGLVPDVPWELDLVPVDYVADAVTALGWQEESFHRCFHLQHPQPLLVNDFIDKLVATGASLRIVPMQEWLSAIEQYPHNPLYEMRAFFTRRWGPEELTYPELNQAGLRSRPTATKTVEALSLHGVSCPSFDDLIAPYAAAMFQGGVS